MNALDVAGAPETGGDSIARQRAVWQKEARQQPCINRIEVPRPFAAVNQELNFTAHIQNRGNTPSTATLLAWRTGDQSLGVANIPELAPGASTSVSLAHEFPTPGVSEMACRLEVKDALTADNEARVLVQVYERLPILIVEEVNPGDPLESDSAFVLAALGARKTGAGATGWHSVFEPTVIEPGALATVEPIPFSFWPIREACPWRSTSWRRMFVPVGFVAGVGTLADSVFSDIGIAAVSVSLR
jgi:hypothetical protein